MPEVTWINAPEYDQHKQEDLIRRGLQCLDIRAEDFEFYSDYGDVMEEDDFLEQIQGEDFNLVKDLQEVLEQYQNLPPFFEYGLSFDKPDPDRPYYRYQLSTGGPGEEIRFFRNGEIQFVYLEWGTGVGFDVTEEDWAVFLREEFEELDMINWTRDVEEV